MKLQFATIFSTKRQQLNITQEQIANYIGVSKAAVSKWEKGHSYPDITLLPKLATYLNTSIDGLLGYEPQLTLQQQAIIYEHLKNRLATEPFEMVEEEILQLTQEYYSCFSFLLLIVQLYLNYSNKVDNKEMIFNKMNSLCSRVIDNSEDINLIQQAIHFQASIALMNNDPQTVIELLGENGVIEFGTELLKATALAMKGNLVKAEEILQLKAFQSIQNLVLTTTELTQFQVGNLSKLEESVKQMEQLFFTYKMDELNVNTVLVFYLKTAALFTSMNELDKAMECIENYCKTCEKIKFPLQLTGGTYFHLIDSWIEQSIQIGKQAPRDEQSIKNDLVNSLIANPMFEPLKTHKNYKGCILRLQKLF